MRKIISRVFNVRTFVYSRDNQAASGRERNSERVRRKDTEREGGKNRERERDRMRSLIVRGNFSHQRRDCRRPRRFSAFPPRFSCSAIFVLFRAVLPSALDRASSEKERSTNPSQFWPRATFIRPVDRAQVATD